MQALLTTLFLLISFTSFCQQFTKGSKVDVYATDGKYYSATIIDVDNKQYKISYDGFGNQYDTWVDGSTIFRAGRKGDRVIAVSADGTFNQGKIEEVLQGQYKVRYDGSSNLTTLTRKEFHFVDNNAPIKMEAAKSTEQRGNFSSKNTSASNATVNTTTNTNINRTIDANNVSTGIWKAGDKVEAMDGEKWYNAIVRERKENGYLLHWEGFSATYDAVVAAEHIRKRTGIASNQEAGTPAEVIGGFPVLSATTWALKSMTRKGDPIKDYSPLPTMDFCKSGRWTLGRYRGTNEGGTYKISGNRITFKNEDGSVWGDYKMTWNASSSILEFTDGNYTIRMIYSSKLNPC